MAGRPRKEWTLGDVEQFTKLCAIFCTKAEVCSVMALDPRTLDRLIAENLPDTPTWAEAFEHYSGSGRAALRRRLFELALTGDRSALIFLAKNYLGMSDNGLVTDKDERPAATVTLIEGGSKWAGGMAVPE